MLYSQSAVGLLPSQQNLCGSPHLLYPVDSEQMGGNRLPMLRSVVSGWKDVLQGGLFGTGLLSVNFFYQEISKRTSFHLLPSESGIWWLH